MSRMADQSFDRFAVDYDRYVSLIPDQHTSWLSSLGVNGERALDAGCGSGIAAEVLAESFEYVVAVDLSRPLIEIAQSKRARPNIRYLVSDLFDLEDGDGFDLVYSHTMVHHLPDYRAGLEHLKRLARPGGTVALIDNVSDRYPTPPRWAYTWPARLTFPREVRRLGLKDAWFQLRFWHSRPWLDHLLSDRYLSREQFRAVYSDVFPGAQFDDLGFSLAMLWTAPPLVL